MAAIRTVGRSLRPSLLGNRIGMIRSLATLTILAVWSGLSASGLFFRDVIPPPWTVATAIGQTLATGVFYSSLLVTLTELLVATLVGGIAALIVGTILGRSDFAARAYEPWVQYLGPTPKIVMFPVVLMLCGAGPESKMALGALSCFFPLALGIAAAIRSVDPVLLRVGRSLCLSRWQTAAHLYMPAVRPALINAFRIVFAVTAVGVLLAETKISDRGLGYLVVESYRQFDIPRMYSLLILVVCTVAGINNLAQRLGKKSEEKRS